MGTISYDPVKDKLAGIIRKSSLLRRVFYLLLDLLFLRGWHIRKILKQECAALDKKGTWHLMDAGCGFGQYDRFILGSFRNVKVLAGDLKVDYLEDCRHYFRGDIKKGRIAFQHMDLLNPNTDRQFDFIICIDVLEHIVEDVVVLKTLSSLLKPGGKLLMHSPSHHSVGDAGDDDESFVGEHARAGYSKIEIKKKYRLAGLKSVKVHYTYGVLGHLGWLLSIKYPMLLLNKTGMIGLLPLIFYYPLVLPFCLVMNWADLYTENERGNGIYALGMKE